MANFLSYSIGIVVLMIASILVVAQNDPCSSVESLKYDFDSCKKCVETVANATAKTNCTFEGTTAGSVCSGRPQPGEQAQFFVSNVTQCRTLYPDPPTPPTPTPGPNTTTTTPIPTTTVTTTVTPTTVTTTIPTTTPSSNATTPTPTPTIAPSNATTVSPTPITPTPTPTPRSSGGMSFASFFAGIVFTLCMSGLGYLVFRFYKARMDRNYQTFSNPTF